MALAVDDGWQEWTDWAKARLRWRILTKHRPEQRTPPGDDWLIWWLRGGRGGGKTRAGSEDVSDFARRVENARIALVGPTIAHVRDTMVEGESGLLNILPPSALRGGSISEAWNRSMGELYFSTGAQAKTFSSERPGNVRGPQHHRAWVDEPAYLLDAALGDSLNTTWNNLMLGMRIGQHPQVIVTGTPAPVALIHHLIERERVVHTRATTYDNLANLSPSFREEVLSRYEGTDLGRQELLAEILENIEGALWTTANLEDTRVRLAPPLALKCVAVDPSAYGGELESAIVKEGKGVETGIIVAGVDGTPDRQMYVLEDLSVRAHPRIWAERVVLAWLEWECDAIVIETNLGGPLAESPIEAAYDRLSRQRKLPPLRIEKARAANSKRARAEPISLLWEQQRAHMVGHFPSLESQLTTWVSTLNWSPDRLDALVWAGWWLKPWRDYGVTSYGGQMAATRIAR